MPQLYTDQTETEISNRFIQKCDALISSGLADTYKEVCDRIEISAASFNHIKAGRSLLTIKMLYNLQIVYKVPVESIIFDVAPKIDVASIKEQLANIHEALDQIDENLSV